MKYPTFKYQQSPTDSMQTKAMRADRSTKETMQRKLWLLELMPIIGISRIFWVTYLKEPDGTRLNDFNNVPYPNARQIFIEGENVFLSNKLIRTNQQMSWAQIWKILDRAFISMETDQTRSRRGSLRYAVEDIKYDGRGTIRIDVI